jgi:hypothetical protein
MAWAAIVRSCATISNRAVPAAATLPWFSMWPLSVTAWPAVAGLGLAQTVPAKA